MWGHHRLTPYYKRAIWGRPQRDLYLVLSIYKTRNLICILLTRRNCDVARYKRVILCQHTIHLAFFCVLLNVRKLQLITVAGSRGAEIMWLNAVNSLYKVGARLPTYTQYRACGLLQYFVLIYVIMRENTFSVRLVIDGVVFRACLGNYSVEGVVQIRNVFISLLYAYFQRRCKYGVQF